MHSCKKVWPIVFYMAFLIFVFSVRADDLLLITEFMAVNETTLKDDFGQYSDWIEIFNSGTSTVDLKGYFLTDESQNLAKWQFPSTNLTAGSYLIVFASGANRAVSGRTLHTNFKLAGDGEYLALVKPDGRSIASEFAPAFPAQRAGVSFGLAVDDIRSNTLIAQGARARVLIPTNSISATWTQLDFDDSTWLNATTAVKFDQANSTLGYDGLSGTDMESEMFGKNPSAYIRIPFTAAEVGKIDDFELLMRYDDGFIAYLNGQEIARRLAPAAPQWDSSAVNQHSNVLALVNERINITDRLNLLRVGTNILAIQGLNRASSDPDFLILPELVARQTKLLTNVVRYFDTPTAGAANIVGLPGVAGSVRFSRSSSTYVEPFKLTLEAVNAAPGAALRYTLDRSVPTESSPIYAAPLNISTSVQVRARVAAPGYLPGVLRSETFIALSSNVVSFTSDLPIMVIHTLGGGNVNEATARPGFISIHEPIRGRSSLTNAPQLTTRASLRARGSSTVGNPKTNFAVELWDEDNQDRPLSILGMPADSDWVFHAPFFYDPALIRNPLTFELSHQMGRYAPRYRFVEVYVSASTAGGPIAAANYFGVYNILEKIKRGKNRVDVDELRPSDLQPPEVTGGYILKIDRLDPGDTGFSAGGKSVAYVDPKEAEIKVPERAAQRQYIANYLNAFNTALSGVNYTNATLGYAPYIDADSWIDQQMIDTLTFNVDALRLSSYFYKPRNHPLVFGPPWDYDRALGSTDGRDATPRSWGDGFFNQSWWNRLFRDPNFWQRWIDRWQDLREGQWSDLNINATVDLLAGQVAEAAPRDFNKWRQAKRGRTQEAEIAHTKNWLFSRTEFISTNLLSKPIFDRGGGQLSAGLTLTMTSPEGASIYYTLDGSDPRMSGGALSTVALIYTGPVPLSTGAVVKARTRDLNHKNLTGGVNPVVSSPWSGLTQARFSLYPPATAGKLIISEIQYHPAPPSAKELAVHAGFKDGAFEFIELKNVSSETLDLASVRFTRGVEFSFTGSSVETLGAGKSVLVVKSLEAFTARYGSRSNVAGQYGGSLDNAGQTIRLIDSRGSDILNFSYQNDWYPITEGHGFSLVLADAQRAPLRWGSKAAWRPSANVGGSPGENDPIPASLPRVVVNEVLSNTSRKDAIELHNPTSAAANIGGWFLTDNLKEPKKFRIPDGTIISPGGYRVFTEDDFKSAHGELSGFALSRLGDSVYLFSADAAGNLQSYLHGFKFGASEKETTFGRFVTTAGDEQFVPQMFSSLGAPNLGSAVGPVVINEIMFHPPDVFVNGNYYDNHEDEFIELRNITGQPVKLFGAAHPANTWRLRSAIDFDFPPNLNIPAQGYLLVVSFDPIGNPGQLAAFRGKYAVNADALIVGPFKGKLDNSADTIKLLKPGEPEPPTSDDAGKVPYFYADSVRYGDDSPWLVAADGVGYSLQRIDSSQFGGDPINWSGGPPTAGSANRRGAPPVIASQPQSRTISAGADTVLAVNPGGPGPFRFQWRLQGANLHGATNAILSITNARPSDAGNYVAVVLNAESASASESATLTVLPAPKIVVHPSGRNVNPGTRVALGVTAIGSGKLNYQWRLNGINLSGATSANLVLTNAQLADCGNYTAVVSDSSGSTTSLPALLNVLVKPLITSQIESQIVFVGDPVTLSASAIGTPPLSFQWRREGRVITDATNAAITFPAVQLSDAGTYSVGITNVASNRIFSNSAEAFLLVYTDFDRDRMADIWEAANGLSTNNAADALLDLDGDGLTNLQEFLADTDPRDAKSYLKFDAIKLTGGTTALEFLARSNRTYSIQFRSSLNSGAWTSLTNIPVRSTNRTETVVDTPPANATRFYRLRTPAQP